MRVLYVESPQSVDLLLYKVIKSGKNEQKVAAPTFGFEASSLRS